VPAVIAVSLAAEGDQAAWDAYVLAHPDAVGYHEWAWRGVFERAFGHTCFYLIARRGSDIAGILPLVEIRSFLFGRTMTSLPFLNFRRRAVDSADAAQALLDEAATLARDRKCRHVELRHIAQHFDQLPCKRHKVTMRLPLATGMWERLDRKARNQVRKAEKSELVATRGGKELLPEFYRVFARNMRDLGTPVYSQQFFAEVLAAFPDRTRLIVVRLKGEPVAAGFTYRTRDMIEIPWASSIRDFNTLCPNHLLYWHAIETAVADSATVFDFGRSTPDEGTYKFKEQWGAAPVELHWEYWLASGGALPDQSPKNPKFKLAIDSWKHMPLWLANLVGPRIVRGIP
jgi:FemAB-related protein (PEP-CTERM system-associated)